MNIPSNIITLILGILITLISLWYGQNHGLMPEAASEDAKYIDSVFNLMMTIATGLFLLVEGILIYCLIKFRRRKGDQTDGPPVEGNVPLEILWTAIPTVIVFVLAVYSFEIYNDIGGLDPMVAGDVGPMMAHHHHHQPANNSDLVALGDDGSRVALGIGPSVDEDGNKPPLIVNVQGMQYAWIFTYPETGIVSGELHMPVDRLVRVNISATDVIHAFWIPQLRLKQDAIPGRDSVLAFKANKVGQYPIICAELCGAYHGGMKSTAYVHTQEDYDQWVKDNTLAQQNLPSNSVALKSTPATDGEFLAPYTQDLGITSETLAQVHPFHQHHGM